MIWVLGDDNVAGTFLCRDIRCTLEEQAVTAGRKMDDDTHGFLLAREGDHLNGLGRLVNFLPILPNEVFGQLKKGGLSLGSYEGMSNVSESGIILVLEGCRLRQHAQQIRGYGAKPTLAARISAPRNTRSQAPIAPS